MSENFPTGDIRSRGADLTSGVFHKYADERAYLFAGRRS